MAVVSLFPFSQRRKHHHYVVYFISFWEILEFVKTSLCTMTVCYIISTVRIPLWIWSNVFRCVQPRSPQWQICKHQWATEGGSEWCHFRIYHLGGGQARKTKLKTILQYPCCVEISFTLEISHINLAKKCIIVTKKNNSGISCCLFKKYSDADIQTEIQNIFQPHPEQPYL